jgi:hypothetical protein
MTNLEKSMKMWIHNSVLVGRAATLPAMAMAAVVALLAIAYVGSCGSSQAFGKNRIGTEKVIVTHGRTYFVAIGGNDNGTGAANRPWATINHAAEQVEPGDTVVVHGGRYILPAQVRVRNSGRSDAWITFIGYPGEEPVFDAHMVPYSALMQRGLDNGAFQIEGVSYIRVANLTLINSHDAGFTIRDSSHINLINNTTKGTFSSGVAVWDTDHGGERTQHIRVIGNTITRATTWDLAPADMARKGEQPQEALSVGGAVDFEIAYNHVYDSDKEGIDIKETSKRGKVHHNLVNGVDRIGIYVDAWFGDIGNVEIFSNIIHDCQLAGLVLGIEQGQSIEHVNIHNNLVFNNGGGGLVFSRFGTDNERRNVQIHNNVFYHNGYSPPGTKTYYWLTGGLNLYSTNVRDISIKNNILSENNGFQIGYTDLFLKDHRSWAAVARQHNIQITDNSIDGHNLVDSPIASRGNLTDRVYAVSGDHAIFGNPLFKNAARQDFSLQRGSPALSGRVTMGAYAPSSTPHLWWKRDFPPRLIRFDGSKKLAISDGG